MRTGQEGVPPSRNAEWTRRSSSVSVAHSPLVASQCEEDLVEARAAHREMVEFDAPGDEQAEGLMRLRGASRHDRKRPVLRTALRRAPKSPLQELRRLVQTLWPDQRDVQKSGADGGLQLAARAFGDLVTAIDHRD